MKKTNFLLVTPALLMLAGCVIMNSHTDGRYTAPVVLAENGCARAVIVLPDDAIPAEATAARELAAHLQQVTGAAFDIRHAGDVVDGARILLGPSAVVQDRLGADTVDSLGDEEYIIRTVGKDLLLAGGRPRGTPYAVYDFLERDVGVRWLSWRLPPMFFTLIG